jgi:hypothetical protein
MTGPSSHAVRGLSLTQLGHRVFRSERTFCLTDLSGKPVLSETLSPNDIAVDALEEAGTSPGAERTEALKEAVLSL